MEIDNTAGLARKGREFGSQGMGRIKTDRHRSLCSPSAPQERSEGQRAETHGAFTDKVPSGSALQEGCFRFADQSLVMEFTLSHELFANFW